MAIFTLPVGSSPDKTYRLELEDVTYSFRFRWNSYDESWQCYVGIAGENPSTKFKIVNGWDLLAQYKHLDGVPKGVLNCVDTQRLIARVGKDNFGNSDGDRFKLFYLES